MDGDGSSPVPNLPCPLLGSATARLCPGAGSATGAVWVRAVPQRRTPLQRRLVVVVVTLGRTDRPPSSPIAFSPTTSPALEVFRIFLIAILELLSLTARLRPQFFDPAHDLLDASVSSQPSDDIVPSRASCLPPRIAALRHPVFRPLPILDPSARQCRQPRIRFLVPPCQQNRLDPAPVPLEAVLHEPSPRRIPVQKGHRKDNG